MQYLSKEEISVAVAKTFTAFTNSAINTPEAVFFFHTEGKWSVAENVQHIIVSTNTSRLAFTLPSFIVRLAGGKPNRDSRSYEELVEKYKKKLAEGGKASGRFVPKPIESKYGKEQLLAKWEKAADKFIKAIKNKTTETKLDDYLVRHPLLGRITLRELCYFTIYHTAHHINTIQNINL